MFDWVRFALAKRAKKRYEPFLATYRNIIGVVPARTRIQGKRLVPEVCLRIYLKGTKRMAAMLLDESTFWQHFNLWTQTVVGPHSGPDFDILIPTKLGGVKTDIVCLPDGFKVNILRKRGRVTPTGLSGIDSKEYDYVGAGMAVSGQSIHIMQSFGSSAWPVVDSEGRLCITSNGHVSEVVGEKFYQANKRVGTNIGTIYPPDVYPRVAPGDFCLAQVTIDRPVRQEIVELGKYESNYHKPRVGMRVTKRGVTRYGSAGFVTENDVVDGPFDCGPVDYGNGKTGVVGNSYDIVAPSDKPHGGGGCSGSGENEVDGTGLLYPAGQLYAGGSDDQGFDHTIFYDWSAAGGPIEKYGLRFNIDVGGGQPQCPDGQHWDGEKCVPDEEPADCDSAYTTCVQKAMQGGDIWTMLVKVVNCVVNWFTCTFGIQYRVSTKMAYTGKGKTKRKKMTITVTQK